MSSNNLQTFKIRLTDHFINEANIMADVLQSKLSQKEIKELSEFLTNSPYARLIEHIQEIARKV
jgi:hypothetical protein